MAEPREHNEKTAWDELADGQKSFAVRMLHWFSYRPRAVARSWMREEVLTWELLNALKVLPRRVCLVPLLETIAFRNSACKSIIDHLLPAEPDLIIDEYPRLCLTGALRNRRSDIGLRHPDGTQLWLEAKTVRMTKQAGRDLEQQLKDQQEALTRISGDKPSCVVALLAGDDAVDGFAAISWQDIAELFEKARAALASQNNVSGDMNGYLLMISELRDRILTHQNYIALG